MVVCGNATNATLSEFFGEGARSLPQRRKGAEVGMRMSLCPSSLSVPAPESSTRRVMKYALLCGLCLFVSLRDSIAQRRKETKAQRKQLKRQEFDIKIEIDLCQLL
jgi:hypothetical protein